MSNNRIDSAYQLAREQFAELGVDAERAVATLMKTPISIHCWQGDDVGGFENASASLGGGLAVTGNYPGKARTAAQLRADFEQAIKHIPGSHRINLHAIYLDTDARVERDRIAPEHFSRWIDWAKSLGIGIDFNPTLFGHPKASDGFTLSHRDAGIRTFWIDHCIASRHIAEAMGKALSTPTVNNVWIPDGMKDTPADRKGPRERLATSLDAIFAQKKDKEHILDAVEGKLFGIGAESYTVGSHEFYLGYAVKRGVMVCLDAGHYHPTESMADKISSVFCHLDEILLHVSRGVRWDSDHVVTVTDDLRDIATELVRGDYLARTHIGLDFFDASINRIAAWVIGVRSMQFALLGALLEPTAKLRELEAAGDYTARLALMERVKTLPVGAVWDHVCEKAGTSGAWMDAVRNYERDVLLKR
jgi:L-rhamnose isomerase